MASPSVERIVDLDLVLVLWAAHVSDDELDAVSDLVEFQTAMRGGDPMLVMAALLHEALLREHKDPDDLTAMCLREIVDQAALKVLEADRCP